MARGPHRFFPTSVLALGALLALGLTVSKTLPAQAPKTFSGQVDIREREIVIDLPDRLKDSRLAPRDFQVLVDGEPREVTRAEPVSREGPAPWTVLVYIDRVLASPGTAFYSNLALAGHAADLTRLGAVEVVLADPDPHPELEPTRDPRKLEQVLAGLAGTARVERDRSRTEAPPPPSADQVGRQLERLLAFLAARHPQGPHALFLVAGGTVGAPEAPFRDASQVLAVSGWVGVAVAARPDDPGRPVAPKNEIDIFQETTAWSNATNGPPPPLPSRAPTKSTLAFPRVIELLHRSPAGAAPDARHRHGGHGDRLRRPAPGALRGAPSPLDDLDLGAGRARGRQVPHPGGAAAQEEDGGAGAEVAPLKRRGRSAGGAQLLGGLVEDRAHGLAQRLRGERLLQAEG